MTWRSNIYEGNNYVLSCFLQRSVDLEFLIGIGKPFHTHGSATQKDWSPGFFISAWNETMLFSCNSITTWFSKILKSYKRFSLNPNPMHHECSESRKAETMRICYFLSFFLVFFWGLVCLFDFCFFVRKQHRGNLFLKPISYQIFKDLIRLFISAGFRKNDRWHSKTDVQDASY